MGVSSVIANFPLPLSKHRINGCGSVRSFHDLRRSAWTLRCASMRDLDTTDAELRLLAAVRRSCQEIDGRVPSTTLMDALLDERNAYPADLPSR
jgi:hypothetical protein